MSSHHHCHRQVASHCGPRGSARGPRRLLHVQLSASAARRRRSSGPLLRRTRRSGANSTKSRLTYFAIENTQVLNVPAHATSSSPSFDTTTHDITQLRNPKAELRGFLERYYSFFPLDALLKLHHRPEDSLVPVGNKLYFLTLFIRNEKGMFFTAQKGLQATKTSGTARGLFLTEALLKIATDKLLKQDRF